MVLHFNLTAPFSPGLSTGEVLVPINGEPRCEARKLLWPVLILTFGLTFPSLVQAQDKPAPQTSTDASPAALVLTGSSPTGDLVKSGAAVEAGALATKAAPSGSGFVNVSKASVLVGSFTVFLLAIFVGFEIIAKVPPTLHTPLMSGSNAISGITVVGAMLTAGSAVGGFGSLLGLLAVVLATINVVGGFLVTHRMLMMFKKR